MKTNLRLWHAANMKFRVVMALQWDWQMKTAEPLVINKNQPVTLLQPGLVRTNMANGINDYLHFFLSLGVW
jgi:hypothetical protein